MPERGKVRDAVDAIRLVDRQRAERLTRTTWGPWQLRRENLTLAFVNGGYEYEVDLESCDTPEELLDWIFQLHGKAWCSAGVMAAFLDAIDDLLEPQASLCSGGMRCVIENPRALLCQRGFIR